MLTPATVQVPVRIWRHYYVRVRLDPDRQAREYQIAVATLRRLEAWLAAHHRPIALFAADGRPKGETVSVFFERTEPEKALAYRAFCNELGLSDSLLSGIVVQVPDERTTPPS